MDLLTFVQDTLHEYQAKHELNHYTWDSDSDADSDSPDLDDEVVSCEAAFTRSATHRRLTARIVNCGRRIPSRYVHKFALHVHARNEETLEQAIKSLMTCKLRVSTGSDGQTKAKAPVFFGVVFGRLLEGLPAAAPLCVEEDFLLDDGETPSWSWDSPLDPYYGKCGVQCIAPRNDAARQRVQTPLAAFEPSFVAARLPCIANYLHLFDGYATDESSCWIEALTGMYEAFEDLMFMIDEGEVVVTIRANECHSVLGDTSCYMPNFLAEKGEIYFVYSRCNEDLSFTSSEFQDITILVVWLSRLDGFVGPMPAIERVVIQSHTGATVVDRSSADLPVYSDERIAAVIVPVSERALLSRANFFQDVFFTPCSTTIERDAGNTGFHTMTVWFDTPPRRCQLHYTCYLCA